VQQELQDKQVLQDQLGQLEQRDLNGMKVQELLLVL
jgi:hypothetical protein